MKKCSMRADVSKYPSAKMGEKCRTAADLKTNEIVIF